MKATIALALLEDAWRQVTDNMVFRFLLLLTLVPISLTFALGFHEEEMELLFGLWRSDYEWLAGFLGMKAGPGFEGRALAIDLLQAVIVSFFGGVLGIVISISATAFFVPRMMEKGAADILFSKPISRLTLLLSRYASGILFVGTLSVLLAAGMYLGLRLRSGHDDAGFLWNAFTLIYVYALLYAFTLLIGVLTRSSAAAIILTVVLWGVCAGVHNYWITEERSMSRSVAARVARQKDEEPRKSEAELRQELIDKRGSVSRFIWRGANTLHHILPRTTEAGLITASLQRKDDETTRPGADTWNRDTFRWDAPLRYNLWFSLGSSLAFAAAMLALAWARLRAVDF